MDVLYGYKAAVDLTIQLMSLATWVLALSITFMRDIAKSYVPTWTLKSSWVLLLLSVIAGIWALMAITGSVFEATEHPEVKVVKYGDNVIIPSALQIFTFLGGIVLLISYCSQAMKVRKTKPRRPRALWGRLRRVR